MKPLALLLLAALVAPSLRAQAAAGDLLVSPARVTLDDRERTAELILSNRGTAADTYRIRLIRMVMDAEGGLKADEAPLPPGAVDPAQLVRFAPHQITLEPGQTQVLRVMLRKPAALPDGEYRVHMLFQALPQELSGAPPAREKAKGVSIRLIPIMGLAIPVVVRQGEIQAQPGIGALKLAQAQGHPALDFQLTRAGNASVYGDLEVVFQPKTGKPVTVGALNGIAVYPPLPSRHVLLPLEAPKGLPLKDGALLLTFRVPGDPVPAAEARLELP
ncbi:MAG TPA: hypothetical protein VFT46_04545 [Holophagaceae bacterium]|nr:hypothetical protein [Holophagaceae bacterium]